jgi:phosphoglycerate-specific signal transduction histidine kinase
MTTNEESGKAEKLFKSFGKRVDQFMVELNEAGGKLSKEFESRYEELKDSAEKLKKEASNKERWKEVEASLKKAGEELNRAAKAAFKKKSPEEK